VGSEILSCNVRKKTLNRKRTQKGCEEEGERGNIREKESRFCEVLASSGKRKGEGESERKPWLSLNSYHRGTRSSGTRLIGGKRERRRRSYSRASLRLFIWLIRLQVSLTNKKRRKKKEERRERKRGGGSSQKQRGPAPRRKGESVESNEEILMTKDLI